MLRGIREAALFAFSALALYVLLTLVTYQTADPSWTHSSDTQTQVHNLGGRVGAWLADILLLGLGFMAYVVPVVLGYSGWLVYRRVEPAVHDLRGIVIRGSGFALLLVAGCALASLYDRGGHILPLDAGGILGQLAGGAMHAVFGRLGTTILLLAAFFSGVTLFTHLSWFQVMDRLGEWTWKMFGWSQRQLRPWWQRLYRPVTEPPVLMDKIVTPTSILRSKMASDEDNDELPVRQPPRIEPVVKIPQVSSREQKEKQVPLFAADEDTTLPPLSILDAPNKSTRPMAKESLEAISRQVELKLADFGIEVQVVAVHPGPVITRYELQPAAGVKVSQITNLAKDLARALSAISVRIVEVIPGKPTVGLEIPNEERAVVQLIDTLRSIQFEAAKSPLTLGLGKDISGTPMVADLAKMPHLLVAGTTGAGKSVALNAMLLSILYNAKPSEVRLILIDPKMLELSIYEGIPHLLAPVVTDMKQAANALRWCVVEMDRRYQLMSALKVRNIAGYNKKVQEAIDAKQPLVDPLFPPDAAQPPPELTVLPYVVVIVDELADMMMLVGKKVEQLIARLAQKARAAGVHLILATQRPSVDVLTGLIKANIPTRIAFQVSSRIDSRTILDQQGAEQLLGHGDMLYLPPGVGVPIRIHGAYVSDQEVQRVVEYLKQQGAPQYEEDILISNAAESGNTTSLAGIDAGEYDSEQDPLYDEAVKIVTESRRASISGIQRRLKIGYNRAARMVEAMQAAGVVGPQESNGNREVLAPAPPKE
ncbi:MAG: DNA translocase FtsK 4TM domain-containing protein [Gammaproteobacteria bacterium]|nr:DNA translocase FtsK 4TM domain-containing protein [Gammaproteobacteria bacterium]